MFKNRDFIAAPQANPEPRQTPFPQPKITPHPTSSDSVEVRNSFTGSEPRTLFLKQSHVFGGTFLFWFLIWPVGLSGCGGTFRYKTNPYSEETILSKTTGLQIKATNRIKSLQTRLSDGQVITTPKPDINGKVCAKASFDGPAPNPKTGPRPLPSDSICVDLEGTLLNTETQLYWLTPEDSDKLSKAGEGKIHFAFQDTGAPNDSPYYSCWGSDLVIEKTPRTKQELEMEVLDWNGFGCNAVKVR